MKGIKLYVLQACGLAAWVLLAPAAHAAPESGSRAADTAFHAAVNEFKRGRISTAYGRFMELAERGDADAARIVLFMHRYGPMLYGTHWDIGLDDIKDWTVLACGPDGRLPPQFRPVLYKDGPGAPRSGIAQPPRR